MENDKRYLVVAVHSGIVNEAILLPTKKNAEWQVEEFTKGMEVTCGLCEGTGKRDDEYVQGKCNGCNGRGVRRIADYGRPDEDDVFVFEIEDGVFGDVVFGRVGPKEEDDVG